jgi:hypothetical protein
VNLTAACPTCGIVLTYVFDFTACSVYPANHVCTTWTPK